MINVSQQFKDESLKNRAFYVTAKCTLANGTVLNMEKGDFYNAGNGIVDSADSSDFPIGVAIEKTATLTLVNDDDRFSGYDFGGSRFVIYLNLQMSDRLETIKRGTFVTVKKPATSEKISLTLADHMYLADREYSSNLLFPATAGEVLRDACQTCGIMLGDASFTNDDYIIQEKPSSTTFRAVIGDIALISGGNARIDEDDRLRILHFEEIDENLIDARTFTTVPQDTIDAGTFDNPSENVIDAGTFRSWSDIHVLQFINNLQYDTDDVVVTGVQTTVDEQTYFYGKDGYVLTFDSPFVSQSPEDALQRIGDIVIGLRMRPFSCQSIANAYATFMDAALVTDQKGRSYFTYITNIDFQFNGYTTFSNDAQSAEELNTEYYSGNSVIVEQSKKETEKLLSAYDIAVQNMNQLAANTLGFYYTQVVNEDGSITAYRHDKPLLADSKIVYKSGIDGFFVTNDYQGTDDATSAAGKWSSGFDSNGDAVLNILYAIGIQADWINTRGLTAKDNNGDVTFRVNADDGSIDMFVNSFTLKGKTIEEIAQEVADGIVVEQSNSTFYGTYVPTLSNYPASNWKPEDYTKHDGNLFYDFLNNNFYVFKATSSSDAYWEKIEGEDAQLDFESVFNALTNNGQYKGIFFENGQLYVNASYLKSGIISADLINLKNVSVSNNSGNTTFAIDSSGNVTIRANTFTLQGSTIQSIADSSASSYANSALNSAKNYTDSQLANFNPDVDLTQQEIFNILTNNGQTQGIYLYGGKIYINASYIDTGILAGWTVNSSTRTLSCTVSGTTISLNASDGNITVSGSGLTATLGRSGFNCSAGTITSLYLSTFNLGSGRIRFDTSSANFNVSTSINSSLSVSGTTTLSSALTVNGSLKVNNNLAYIGNGLEVYGGAEISGGIYLYSLPANTTAAVVRIGTGGRVFQTGQSSKRYKDYVRNMEIEDVEKLYDIPVIYFKYKEGYLASEDERCGASIPGFYAEDMQECFKDATDHIEIDGETVPDNWNERMLIPAMMKLIQSQHEEIETLKSNQSKILQALSKAGIEVEL